MSHPYVNFQLFMNRFKVLCGYVLFQYFLSCRVDKSIDKMVGSHKFIIAISLYVWGHSCLVVFNDHVKNIENLNRSCGERKQCVFFWTLLCFSGQKVNRKCQIPYPSLNLTKKLLIRLRLQKCNL